ncbi:MAG: phosphoribosylformylglycinamidine synthase subunit PurS [Kofleriaceae bacterium]|nr:phosphoribosylformylglycinamidine synthase subunit PurS [Kofleriaceae bacterium]
MKAKVYVTLKTGVLDPQGQAVSRTLGKLGFDGVESVRIGKYVEIEMADQDLGQAEKELTKMCEKLIVNTVIEDYRIELDGGE